MGGRDAIQSLHIHLGSADAYGSGWMFALGNAQLSAATQRALNLDKLACEHEIKMELLIMIASLVLIESAYKHLSWHDKSTAEETDGHTSNPCESAR